MGWDFLCWCLSSALANSSIGQDLYFLIKTETSSPWELRVQQWGHATSWAHAVTWKGSSCFCPSVRTWLLLPTSSTYRCVQLQGGLKWGISLAESQHLQRRVWKRALPHQHTCMCYIMHLALLALIGCFWNQFPLMVCLDVFFLQVGFVKSVLVPHVRVLDCLNSMQYISNVFFPMLFLIPLEANHHAFVVMMLSYC